MIRQGWLFFVIVDFLVEENEDFVRPVCRLLSAFGETYTCYIIAHFTSPAIIGFLQILLQCTGYPGFFSADEEISDLPLQFWYMLQDTLLDHLLSSSGNNDSQMSNANNINMQPSVSSASLLAPDTTVSSMESLNESSANDADTADNFLSDEARLRVSEVFAELVVVLHRKCLYPPEEEWMRWSSGAF